MLIKKRQVLTATLIIALCAAITVNWYFTKPQSENSTLTTSAEETVTGNLGDTLFVAGTTAVDDKNEALESTYDGDYLSESQPGEEIIDTVNTDEVSSENYFSEAKLKRENYYDETVENIEKILDNDNIGQEEINKISTMLSDYQNDMKVQTDAENLISAKIGGECLVVINEENCQVVVEKNTLNDTLILQITEIIEKNTDIFSENLSIIELK